MVAATGAAIGAASGVFVSRGADDAGDAAGDAGGAGDAEGGGAGDAGGAAAALLRSPWLNVYPVVTRIPCCSTVAQLYNETAPALMPVIPSGRRTGSPATPLTSLLPVLASTKQ